MGNASFLSAQGHFLIIVCGSTHLIEDAWSPSEVPAFNPNGDYISFAHPTPLAAGETQQVAATFTGGGWSAQWASAALPPAVAVRADNFAATSASGTIKAVGTSPLRLQIDVTTQNAAGETIRLTGEVGFAYQKVTRPCVSPLAA